MLLIDAPDAGQLRREAEIDDLWSASFGTSAMVSMWRLDGNRLGHTVIELADDRIVGAVVLVPARMVTATGGLADVVGIGNVSTHPDHRGRGIAAKLMREAAHWAADVGADWGVLFTDTPGLYRSLGWRGFALQYVVGAIVRPLVAQAGAKVSEEVSFSNQVDLHRATYQTSPMTSERTPWHWHRAQAWYSDAELWIAGDQEEPDSYLVLRRDPDRIRLWEAGGPLERILDVVVAALAGEPVGRQIEARFTDVSTLCSSLGQVLGGLHIETDSTGMVKPFAGIERRWADMMHHPRAHHLYGDYY